MKNKLNKRILWYIAIDLCTANMLISNILIYMYDINKISLLGWITSMIFWTLTFGLFVKKQVKMKKKFDTFEKTFRTFKDSCKKEESLKELKKDEKVEEFEVGIKDAAKSIIQLGEKWLEEDEMAESMLEDVKSIVRETKNMIAKL